MGLFQKQLEPGTPCERCGATEGVRWVDAMTAYSVDWKVWDYLLSDEDEPEDPNRDQAFCPPCAKEHDEYWTAMWAEYNSGRL